MNGVNRTQHKGDEMTATIKIEFEIDGERPAQESLEAAVWKLITEYGYIGSEEIDGIDTWGLELGLITVEVGGES